MINSIYSEKRLGLLIPEENQREYMNTKWKNQNDIVIENASPYLEKDEIISSCLSLKQKGVEAILMDCMGYTESMKEEVQKKTGMPVILSNVLTLKVISELI